MFISFAVVLLVTIFCSYLNEQKNIPVEKVHWAFYVTIFSNMTLRQRACYKIVCHFNQCDVSSVWIKDKKRVKMPMLAEKWKYFEESVFGPFWFFQRWQLKVGLQFCHVRW